DDRLRCELDAPGADIAPGASKDTHPRAARRHRRRRTILPRRWRIARPIPPHTLAAMSPMRHDCRDDHGARSPDPPPVTVAAGARAAPSVAALHAHGRLRPGARDP